MNDDPKDLETRLREQYPDVGNQYPGASEDQLYWLRLGMSLGAEIERRECDLAAADAGHADDTAYQRGAKIRQAIRARNTEALR